MGRYEHTKIKTGKFGIKSNRTTIYQEIPERDDDIWVITQHGDRLDNLAHQFYGNVNLWWYIAKANNLTFMTLPSGTSLRIPATTQYAIGT
jgi:nucleoid-associated protein YgaU